MNNECGLNRLQAAKYLGIKRGVLENWEKHKVKGLVFMKVDVNGRNSIYYEKSALETFKKNHTFGESGMTNKSLKPLPQFVIDAFLHVDLVKALKKVGCRSKEVEKIEKYISFKLFVYKHDEYNKRAINGYCTVLAKELGSVFQQTKISNNDQKELISYLVNKLKERFIDVGVLYQSDLLHDNKKQEMIYSAVAEYEIKHFYGEFSELV